MFHVTWRLDGKLEPPIAGSGCQHHNALAFPKVPDMIGVSIMTSHLCSFISFHSHDQTFSSLLPAPAFRAVTGTIPRLRLAELSISLTAPPASAANDIDKL